MGHRTIAIRTLAVAAAALAAVTAVILDLPGIAHAAPSRNWYGAAPYVMPLDNNPPDLGQVMSATGQKTFELAFILASGGCSPAWDGTAPVSSDSAVGNVISSIRGAGGDVSVSAGGYGGTKLGQVCSDPQSTAAYQQVISKYALKAIDFDLEEPEYENSTAIANELGAAQILQRNNPGLLRVGHHGRDQRRNRLVRHAAPQQRQDPGLHARQLLDHALRRPARIPGSSQAAALLLHHRQTATSRWPMTLVMRTRTRYSPGTPLRAPYSSALSWPI